VLETARGTIHIATAQTLSRFVENVPAAPAVAAIGLRFKDADALRRAAARRD